MRRLVGLAVVVLGSCFATGCSQPYFMTQIDYEYYNRVSADYDHKEYDQDILAITSETPRTIRDPRGTRRWELSLEEAKRIALENNKLIAVLENQPGAQGALIDFQLAQFDTNFELGGQWGLSEQQVNNTVQVFGTGQDAIRVNGFGPTAGGFGVNTTDGGATQAFNTTLPGQNVLGFSKRTAAGGIMQMSYALDYQRINPVSVFTNINPSWRSSVLVNMQQPLLQGAGVEFNRAPILIARANYEQSIKDFETQVRTLLRDVEVAYWQLYFTYQDLYSREVGLKQGLATWQKVFSQYDVGQKSLADLAQAREQYEFFRAAFFQAETRVLQAEGDLRQLLGLPPDDGRQIIPADDPTVAEYEPNWSLAVQESMQLRPELAARRYAIRSAEIELLRQKNGLKPDLTVVGSYGVSGLDDQFDKSINVLADNRFSNWTAGVRYRRAIGERAAHATVRQAQLNLSQARAALRNDEHLILHALRTTYQNLITAYELIGVQRTRRLAAAQQVESNEQFYLVGNATLDLLLRSQSIFADTLRDESSAIVQYNQALAEWEFVKGTILENDNVAMAEEVISCLSSKKARDRACEAERYLPLPIWPGDEVHGDSFPCPDTTLPLYPPVLQVEGEAQPPEIAPTSPPAASGSDTKGTNPPPSEAGSEAKDVQPLPPMGTPPRPGEPGDPGESKNADPTGSMATPGEANETTGTLRPPLPVRPNRSGPVR